jgi:hypothetical protein
MKLTSPCTEILKFIQVDQLVTDTPDFFVGTFEAYLNGTPPALIS